MSVVLFAPMRRGGLGNAAEIEYLGPSGSVPTRVVTAEYLIAIALNVRRSKDYERVFRLLSEAKVDRKHLEELIRRFRLDDSWQVFLRRYPEFA